jgi:hypothetical protein
MLLSCGWNIDNLRRSNSTTYVLASTKTILVLFICNMKLIPTKYEIH